MEDLQGEHTGRQVKVSRGYGDETESGEKMDLITLSQDCSGEKIISRRRGSVRRTTTVSLKRFTFRLKIRGRIFESYRGISNNLL